MSESIVKLDLRELMKGKKQITLEHDNKLYMLSITRRGKLILTAAY